MTESPVDLVGMLFRVHDALDSAGLSHAFGGALALAWCVPEPRATADIDLNVFVPVDELDLPFLACLDLAVFKAFFDRGKDWVDIEQMLGAGAFDASDAIEILSRYLGPEDHRIARLKAMQEST